MNKIPAIENLVKGNPKVDPVSLAEVLDLVNRLRTMGFKRPTYNLSSPFERGIRPIPLQGLADDETERTA